MTDLRKARFIEQGDVNRAREMDLSGVPAEIERPLAVTLRGGVYSNFGAIEGDREKVLADPNIRRDEPFRVGVYPYMSGYTGRWVRVGSVTEGGEFRPSNLGRSVARHV